MNCKAMQRANIKEFRRGLRLVFLSASCMIMACFFTIASSVGQSGVGQSSLRQSSVGQTSAGQSISVAAPRSVISLASSPKPPAEIVARRAGDARFEKAPANYHIFPAATAGENNGVEELTLNFAGETTLARIESTNKDFVIERGGTCEEGDTYRYGESCSLLVRFNPQGPGHRLGFVRVTHSAAATPALIGLMGNGYAPVISFLPAQISTVPGTFKSGAGLLSGALNLAVDGSDALYMADTGNNAIRYLDSSGAIVALSSVFGTTAPVGITVDTTGNVYFTQRSPDDLQVIGYGGVATIYDAGTSSCAYGATCALGGQPFTSPGGMATDPSGNVFLNSENGDLRIVPVPDDIFENGIPLYLQYNYPFTNLPIAVDASDNLYSYYNSVGACAIFGQSYYNATIIGTISTRVAGGRTCGFSGDGGQAGNAEIGASVGQLAFDIGGNFYFTDTNNNRVRRIDGATGIIHTIAGNGTAGYTGDGGRATTATLKNPTGVAVNSQGTVYIISSASTGQVIRQVGPQGYLAFGNQGKGIASAVQLVTVSNTGNDAMTLTNAEIVGANKGDFKIDTTTTTCILTQGTELFSGQTCRIGVIFMPAVVGSRTATLTLLDNTVNGADSVTLTGAGVLSTPTFKITAPASGASFTSGTAVAFSVSVTAASGGVQPTGTVQFKVDGANHGGAVTLSGTGTASTSLTGLTTASHTLSATYSGDANYAAAGPITVSITVKAAAAVKFTEPTATQELSSTSAIGLAVDVTTKSAPAPTGKVMFSVDGKCMATAAIVSGTASAKTGTLAAGTHTVEAVYVGDAHHSAAKASQEITVSH
jgi:hypothetical protein